MRPRQDFRARRSARGTHRAVYDSPVNASNLGLAVILLVCVSVLLAAVLAISVAFSWVIQKAADKVTPDPASHAQSAVVSRTGVGS